MRHETYGLGGYDPSKPDNNLIHVHEVEDHEPEPVQEAQVIRVEVPGPERRIEVPVFVARLHRGTLATAALAVGLASVDILTRIH